MIFSSTMDLFVASCFCWWWSGWLSTIVLSEAYVCVCVCVGVRFLGQITLIEQMSEELAPDRTAACSSELCHWTGATVLKEFGLRMNPGTDWTLEMSKDAPLLDSIWNHLGSPSIINLTGPIVRCSVMWSIVSVSNYWQMWLTATATQKTTAQVELLQIQAQVSNLD